MQDSYPMKRRTDRFALAGGAALATVLATAGPAAAQETRFQLRNGTVVCGAVLSEQGLNLIVQPPNGLQIVLRRDQIAQRQVESCGAAAAAAATTAVAQATPASGRPAAAGAPAAAAAPAPAVQLRFGGSTTMGERMVPDLVDAYFAAIGLQSRGWAHGTAPNERLQDGRSGDGGRSLRATLSTSGAQGAFPALNELRTDIAMATRRPTAEELTAFRGAYGLDGDAMPQEQVVALDGLAVIVNAENPVQRLTLDQLRDVYAGTVTSWSQLGGPNRPIQLFARESASAALGPVQRRGEARPPRRPGGRAPELGHGDLLRRRGRGRRHRPRAFSGYSNAYPALLM